MGRRRGKRGRGSIVHRAGKYQAQYSRTVNGKRIRQSATFPLRSEAEWWLREAGRGSAPDVDLTVAEYLERWLAGKRKVRASTLALYRSHVETWINPALGGISITALQPRHVEAFVSELGQKRSRMGRPLATSTVGAILTTLRSALGSGVKRRELPDNAAMGVEPPDVEREPVAGMTPKEALALVDAVKGHWLEPLVRFLLGSGVRIGEALALDQRDVEPGFVRIRRSKTVPRTVVISEDASKALAEAIRLAPRVGPREPVFFGVKGDRLTREVATHALPRLTEKAGLRRISPHAIRHGVATLMVAGGAHMRVVADQLGHANPSLTARVYAHVLPDSTRAAVSLLDEAIKR